VISNAVSVFSLFQSNSDPVNGRSVIHIAHIGGSIIDFIFHFDVHATAPAL
jgi:hypothetical protein